MRRRYSWRAVNLSLAIGWATLVAPALWLTGGIFSIAVVNTISVYTVVVAHLTGWRADVPTEPAA